MAATDPPRFPHRAHLSALGLRMQYSQEDALLRWAQWAKDQVAQWPSPSDPGSWDPRPILSEIAI